MNLCKLFPNTNYDLDISSITSDSRFVKENSLFIPLKGNNFNGDEFIYEAITKGACCIVSEKLIPNITIPVIVVKDVFQELIRILQIFYGKPYENLKLIGVTGTDGKTTISTLTSYILNEVYPSAYIGTNGINSCFDEEDNLFTTPILSKTYEILNKFQKQKIKYVSMEVSSQGIATKRITTLEFDYAIFSNLSHEHLDTHKTMNNYFKTKFELFKQLKPNGISIVNKDDNYSKYFDELNNVVYYSLFMPSDYQAINIKYYQNYATFDLLTKNQIYKNFKINRTEEYNIYNILPSIIIALKENIPLEIIYHALSNLPLVPGRMEKVPTPYPFEIYVDFAHTPNAIKNMLLNIRKRAKKRLILVCGAAGCKDTSKRPLMGRYATELSDLVIFTSEDPKTENPDKIIDDLTKNLTCDNYEIIPNRKQAIDKALQEAKKDDIVIVSGKGKETHYEENNVVYEYSDFDYILNHK